ncbi:DUF6232 family protein [Planktothrix agardhii 1033]|nr:DUF6232 family protein [Planktothrix agardhii 1033]
MAASNSFGDKSISIQKEKVITVTRKTIRFGKSVYQTHNITGFSEGELKLGQIPWSFIIILFIIGLIVFSFNKAVGIIITMIASAAIYYNFTNSKHYGLLLTLNSGDKQLFVTSDTSGLKQVISDIYDFIEKEKDVAYQISVNNGSITGNIIQGDSSTALFKSE